MTYYRKRRKKLLSEDPHCYWCGCEVFEAEGSPRLPNHATIDHLYSRAAGPRPRLPGVRTLVLCCLKCNTARSKLQQIKPNRIEAWCLSGSFPRSIRILRPIFIFFYRHGMFKTKNLRLSKKTIEKVRNNELRPSKRDLASFT